MSNPNVRGVHRYPTGTGRPGPAAAASVVAGAPGRTFGYARVSTAEQTTDLQRDALRAAGAVEVIADDATSGTTAARDRAGFAGLAEMLQPGDTVVVYSLSRLGRSTLDVLTTVQWLDRQGVHLRSLTEKLDTGSPMGRAMLTIMAAIAQLERDMCAERTRDGIAAARARGARPGRPALDHSAAEAALLSGQTVAQVCESTGLSESTVRRVAKKLAGAPGP